MKEIKALVFDMGGVIASENNLKDHYIPLCNSLGINKENFFKLRDKHIQDAAIGKITGKQLIRIFSKELNIDYPLFLNNWIKYKKRSIRKNRELIQHIKRLKKEGYTIGLLTGVMDIHHKIIKDMNLYKHFHHKIFSFKVGINKPHINIYRLLIKKINLDPKEILVIDDHNDCAKPTKELRLNFILFRNNRQLFKDLKKLGVK